MQRRYTELFVKSAGAILLLTGAAKVLSRFGHAKILAVPDPILNLSSIFMCPVQRTLQKVTGLPHPGTPEGVQAFSPGLSEATPRDMSEERSGPRTGSQNPETHRATGKNRSSGCRSSILMCPMQTALYKECPPRGKPLNLQPLYAQTAELALKRSGIRHTAQAVSRVRIGVIPTVIA